ncbi:DUF488 domain-containing protein [Curtobacterium pusillum]|uniref:DUF488 domain-containing protein n=1 Tax=Curtobacterium pusillum TaxID=69373 RepID=A0ABX2M793_9MICO|nr:DUF488 domain-containing protein [Curtobacterium pusillum]NUU12653.1 DUF488 domain-containing protein [Curtobacterium pusillum]GLK33082.1 hypothetical protein GCM10017610_33670 [Curtobacterium pusillum]
MTVRVKRAYEPAEEGDGYRVLVDRLWPRGVSKDDARIAEWSKDVAPSADLRKWFGHDADRFDSFRERYRAELDGSEALEHLRRVVHEHPIVTLVYGARDEEHNQAVVLAELLMQPRPGAGGE